MKKFQLLIVTILTCFLLSSFSYIASSEINKNTIQYVIDGTKSIKKYQVNLNAKIFPPNASDLDPKAPDEFDPNRFMEVKSIVFGESGKKMKMQIAMKMPEMGAETEHTLIFDGTWLWVQQKVIKHPSMKTKKPMISAMKIHIPSVSPDPINEPFNTIYGVAGTGIFKYKDLPGTFMELIEDYDLVPDRSKTDSKFIVFSGIKNPAKQEQKMKGENEELREFMEKSTNYCKLWVSEDNGLIKAYSIGKSEKRPTMKAKIDYISLNQELTDDTFLYVPPEGVIVRDVTTQILKQKGKR
ncbi:hypothetical protein ACFL2O_08830 [Thermodesulfobacteriota bacterium]